MLLTSRTGGGLFVALTDRTWLYSRREKVVRSTADEVTVTICYGVRHSTQTTQRLCGYVFLQMALSHVSSS